MKCCLSYRFRTTDYLLCLVGWSRQAILSYRSLLCQLGSAISLASDTFKHFFDFLCPRVFLWLSPGEKNLFSSRWFCHLIWQFLEFREALSSLLFSSLPQVLFPPPDKDIKGQKSSSCISVEEIRIFRLWASDKLEPLVSLKLCLVFWISLEKRNLYEKKLRLVLELLSL